jgi:ribonuclease P/MRP protein subunit POP7
VKKYLDEIESRASGPGGNSIGRKSEQEVLRGIEDSLSGKGNSGKEKGARDEEVLVKGTGKAIEKVLRIACYWLGQEGVKVVVRTGSVGAVDDVVETERKGKKILEKDEPEDAMEGVVCEEEGDNVVEESRIRRVSYVEVAIRLR